MVGVSCLAGVEVNQEQQFVVDTKGAGGQGHLEVTLVIVVLFFSFLSIQPSNFLPSCVCVCVCY